MSSRIMSHELVGPAARSASTAVRRFIDTVPALFQRVVEIVDPLRLLFRMAGAHSTHHKTRDNLIAPYFKTWPSKLGALAIVSANSTIVLASAYIFNPITGDMWAHAGNPDLLRQDIGRLFVAAGKVILLYAVRDVVLGLNQAFMTRFAKDRYTDVVAALAKCHDMKKSNAAQGLADIDILIQTGSAISVAANTSLLNIAVFSTIIFGFRPETLFVTVGFCLLKNAASWQFSKGTIPLLSNRAIFSNKIRSKFENLTRENNEVQIGDLKSDYREMLFIDIRIALVNAGLGLINFAADTAGRCIPFYGSTGVGHLARMTDAVNNLRSAA
ncbi:MAG: hypothetical protein JOY96_10220, partial [Verrucomicrobia bacterium]|nr:hypothetical protein [Verrucomicrobiota bacterium]